MDQGAATGGEGNLLAADLLDHLALQALQQGDAGVEGLAEIELAAHCARGDVSHLVLDPQGVGQLVDALFVDHGGVHVSDENLLAAAFGGHQSGVNPARADYLARDLERVG
ncbi:hypothetical protein FQZ97_1080110 [compost metagenome]